MRIDLLAPPFSGHLHPVLAIARELAAEFEVRVISTAGAQARIHGCGLRGVAILSAADEALLLQIANPPHAVKSNPLRMNRQFRDAIQLMGRVKRELRELYRSEPPDLLIADFTLPAAGLVAQELGIAWWTSMPSPCVIETCDGPPAYMGGMIPGQHWTNRLRHAVARRMVRTFKGLIYQLHRRAIEELGIQQLYREDGSEVIYSPTQLLALGVEALEFERTWPTATRFMGPMLFTPDAHCTAPTFEPGRRHVLVTAGTHLKWIKNELAAATLQVALAMPDVVFHFTDGDEAAPHLTTTRNFVRLSYVDYDKYLDRYALVVHHGGAGIMYYCLALGTPAVVYPIDYDQFDHAARLEQAKVALWLRDLRQLEHYVRLALDDPHALPGCKNMQTIVRRVCSERPLINMVRQLPIWQASLGKPHKQGL